jgi:predicted acylesterase/phospholipase RssA
MHHTASSAAAEPATPAGEPFVHPARECDLVMKGGITSGIIYPPAVLELAREYRFRSIGGTSAGAIAAAVTAAAEYGRESGGFETLRTINEELSKGTFLRDLFQPAPATRPMFDTAFALSDELRPEARGPANEPRRKPRGIPRLVLLFDRTLRRTYPGAYLDGAPLGLLAGLATALLLTLLPLLVFSLGEVPVRSWTVVVLFLLLAVPLGTLGWYLGGLARATLGLGRILAREVPRNMLGLCTGRTEESAPGAGLTDWLCSRIDEASGTESQQRPLTFGALKAKQITLRMVTTNLSQRQPYELPFTGRRFIFSRAEFSKLFPEYVVEHLVKHAYASGRVQLPDGFHFLPDEDDLPVAVAMRMSLSFPVLISAVPVYTIAVASFARRRGRETLRLAAPDLQRQWLSDGGISSNFPIHFFDAWLPSRPTFGIKLTSFPQEAFGTQATDARLEPEFINITPSQQLMDPDASAVAAAEGEDPGAAAPPEASDPVFGAVYLPRANDVLAPEWHPLAPDRDAQGRSGDPSLLKFLWAIFATAQDYRDNTQSVLPSYRERIVQVRLGSEEGGLNLTMDPRTIERVVAKGRLAGTTLRDDFNFDHHRWVRLRVLMGRLEEELREMRWVMEEGHFDFAALIAEQLASGQAGGSVRFPYPRGQAWVDSALGRLEALTTLLAAWESPVFAPDSPQPEPVLRVTPRL